MIRTFRSGMLSLGLIGSGLFASACATGPEIRPAPEDEARVEVVAETPAPAVTGSAAKLGRGDDEREAPRAVEPPVAADPRVDAQARAAFDRGVAASRTGALEVAQQELEAALKRDGKLAYGWTNLGVIHERRGNPKAAEDAYLEALKVEPDQEIAWDYLTRLRCRAGRVPEAEAFARRATGARPTAVGPRIALAYTLLQQAKYDAAAAEAKRALKEDERNVRAMQLLSQVYFRQGRYELAAMVLENARAIHPYDPVVLNSIGLVSLQLGSKVQAMEAFKQAVRLQPDYAEANSNYGALLNEAQDYDAAVQVLEAAVASAPNLPSARLNLGNAYRGRGELPKAVAQYEKVLQLRPDWADTYYNLAILHLDQEVPGLETIPRLQKSLGYFAQYRAKGGKDERVEQYLKDANRGIEREQRRLERLERDKLKRAAEEDEAKKKKEQEEARRRQNVAPASKLGEEDDEEAVKPAARTQPAARPGPAPAASGKLSEDDK